MFRKRFYYLVTLQYLGYRFHGWQKQPKLKTLHFMLDRTLNYVLEDQKFKTMASGRTDAMVSAHQAAFELFLEDKPLENNDDFLRLLNTNLPQDMRALEIKEVSESFNILQDVKKKEYIYLFAHGGKFHPFCAPIMTTILDELDVELMQAGAKLFQGHHNFKAYCYKPSDTGEFMRTIDHAELVENSIYKASFFPEKTYLFRVVGKGFGRNQVRLMMGALIDLGKHKIDLDYIKQSLMPETDISREYVAPASGLILNRIEFE